MHTILEQQDEVSSLRNQEKLRQKCLIFLLATHCVPSVAISRFPLSPSSKKWDHIQTDREFKEAILLVGYNTQFDLQSHCLPARACIVLSTVLEAIKKQKKICQSLPTRGQNVPAATNVTAVPNGPEVMRKGQI
jgi:hypothetical protein